MRTHTTCASCGGGLTVEQFAQQTHPACPPSPRTLDQLRASFLAAAEAGQDATADRLAHALDSYHPVPDFLGAALAYAAWGWPVFPCRPGGKTPLIARDAGGRGLHDATTDADQIKAWWGRTPTANVGLATGQRFDVIDVDPAGLKSWADIRSHLLFHTSRQAPVDIHGQVSTPRGGHHIYLEPLGLGSGNLADHAAGLDFRGRGGYVLAPPSELVPAALKGHPVPPWPLRYTWLTYPSPLLTGGSS